MRRLIILGNCVAQRIAMLLQKVLKYSSAPAARLWELVIAPPVYNLSAFSKTPEDLAALARQCDVVFTQPLFNFGPLNTAILKELPGIQLHTFSAPNFEAYFPDVIHPSGKPEQEKFPPPLEWHSRIFLECKAAGASADQAEEIYFNHPLFRAPHMAAALEKAWAVYELREKEVEIGTLNLVRGNFSSEPLFFTWKHPGDRIIAALLKGFLERLGLSEGEIESAMASIPFLEKADQPHIWSEWGFGFNSWPIIARHHKFFNFKGREFFRTAGLEIDIMTAYIAWSRYYDEHPAIFASLLKNISA